MLEAMALPLMPEAIAPEDGAQKQDCERNAAKGWLATHAVRVSTEIAACARARWKIENEGFSVLKSIGYHLEHDFGHGKRAFSMRRTLLHGGGYFHRDKWPKERRWAILMRLAKLPAEFALPVVFGHIIKKEQNLRLVPAMDAAGRNRNEIVDLVEPMNAFGRAEIAIERQMHRFSRNEICILIAEDTDRIKVA